MKIKIFKPQSVITSAIKNIKTKYTKLRPAFLNGCSKDCFEAFKPIRYQRCGSLADIHIFCALNFPDTFLQVINLSDGNNILRTMCRLHNMTKGKVKFPPVIETFKNKKCKYDGDYADDIIRLNRTSNNISSTLAHEIAHYNHEQFCENYLKMGKKSEIEADGITDFSILENFMKDKAALKIIKKHLGNYATSSPCEMVACTFESLFNGKILPTEIWELYNKYEGPFAQLLKPLFAK